MSDRLDPLELTQALVRIPSVVGDAVEALDWCQERLVELGFSCRRLRYDDPAGQPADNLVGVLGDGGPRLAFVGHVDVVPVVDEDAWRATPFGAEIQDGEVVGRGVADMKGAVAAFMAAVDAVILDGGLRGGSVMVILTDDEEGDAVNGVRKVVETLEREGVRIDHALVGEPTNPQRMGEALKVGRRGSFNCKSDVICQEGHVAYPHLARNPLPPLLDLLQRLRARPLDEGIGPFQPSNLEITSIDVGNPSHNVIPRTARVMLNVRFNIRHDGESLEAWVRREANAVSDDWNVEIAVDARTPAEPYYSEPDWFVDLVMEAVEAEIGLVPEVSTSGGSSDARFVSRLAPTLEFGLVGATMHKVDERAAVSDIRSLSAIYARVLRAYLTRGR